MRKLKKASIMIRDYKGPGFTIIELLIVIVVIGILAAISTIAYVGIQNRARDTAVKQSAFQLKTKVEAWQGQKGSYPTTAQIVTDKLNDPTVPEALLGDDLAKLIKNDPTPDTHTGTKPIGVVVCGSPQTGLRVNYHQSGGTIGTYVVGVGC